MTSLDSIDPAQLQALLSALDTLKTSEDLEETGQMADDDLAYYALRRRFGGNLVFNRSIGWRFFRAGASVWDVDYSGDDVSSEVQSVLRELRESETDPRRSASLGSKGKRDNVVAMLRGLPEVRSSDVDGWDANPDLLAAPNGVVDLRTGELMQGRPAHRLTKAVTVDYDPDAEAPRFERFMSEVFGGDQELVEYVQRLLGYGITGHVREQCFAVLFGEGSNGKSTLLTVLREILGEHAGTIPFDAFTTSGRGRGGPDAELLVGVRLALASETNRSAVLDAAAIKNATGGEEINVNPKYRDPYSFKPQALILLASNYKPVIREQDSGTWRRVKLLPFLQRFEGDQKDLTLDDTLRREHPGILAWLVRGAMEWYRHGLDDPASVRDAVREYREESDPLDGFFPGVLAADADAREYTSAIWRAYQQWAEAEGKHPFRDSGTLTKALMERDRSLRRFNNQGRGLVGVRVVTADAGPAGPGVFAGE
ncbi:phage/plasmid primase, P4 family [Streptomyces sp. Ru87]|uniref:DNA primase family protein n=1 Tax=Streptomyces sp. Ru87 TaxID=2044307 RepID=UPI000BF79771|nr:phage/plasmid primase, P4 family [Streptomyces sp. Ru87]PGH49933.1 hypothetical protein CRI70_14800 [Streptomyces sp. Ru87]